ASTAKTKNTVSSAPYHTTLHQVGCSSILTSQKTLDSLHIHSNSRYVGKKVTTLSYGWLLWVITLALFF
ncbi:hypothetical protein P4613_20775, partial [Halalkalibacterium halodurans]|uniref:hypothetical protein n=1 Tax=Halalkalibacterium halodurans TaxID=86665 RepID=UPI002E1CD675|nr:hypothetical protein [Halalkalibacterium halodurans]